jgi:DEAD/DEAH box helicase domain-containing protein
MLPSIVTRQVEEGLKDFLKSTFTPSSPGFDDIIHRFTEDNENLFKGPYLTFDMPFRESDLGLDYFPEVPLAFTPYMHQERAFKRIGAVSPLSTIIATGTGSGKTECFSWPILDYCLKNNSSPGIKAIFIYPMNALATDQARRLASTIWSNDNLKGKVTVGLYADKEPEFPSVTMTEGEVITSRNEIRTNPPDILITNYKMLDYMLVRPIDKGLWAANSPETLHFLVVDELHTFDGAQGTDLACLIRRIKDRLECPKDHICCVGTSATLGNDGTSSILSYATQVFGEAFDEEAVIVEDRKKVSDYLSDFDVEHIEVPSVKNIGELLLKSDGLASDILIKEIYTLWFGEEPAVDVNNNEWRVQLKDNLDRHLFLHSLLRALDGKPQSYSFLLETLKKKSYLKNSEENYIRALVDTFSVLVSHARKASSIDDETSGVKNLQPYFNVRLQLWIRELKRMVGNLSTPPSLQYSDDLMEDALKKNMPVIHCKDCGGTGWAAVYPMRGMKLNGEPKNVYENYFGYSDRLRFVFLDNPGENKNSAIKHTQKVRTCIDCLNMHDDVESVTQCSSCTSKNLLDVFLYDPKVFINDVLKTTHDCPFCGRSNGMGILGAQSPTLLSASVATIFATGHNDDPKLLAFSDSVQDAAHRAGFFEARSYRAVLRTALYHFLKGGGEVIDFDDVISKLPSTLRAMGDAEFVTTFIPQDQQWKEDYEILLENGTISSRSKLPDVLEDRISWEIFSELSYNSQNGQTLDKAGLICIHPEVAAIIKSAQEMTANAKDELGPAFEVFSEQEWMTFILGIINRLCLRGAILTDTTLQFLAKKAKWYDFTYGTGRSYDFPRLAKRAPRPVFPASSKTEGYDYIGGNKGKINWFTGWADKIFLKKHALAAASYNELYQFAFDALVNNFLVDKRPIDDNYYNGISWGLLTPQLKIWKNLKALRCSRCGHSHGVPFEAELLWEGTPCLKLGCEGVAELYDNSIKKDYFDKIYGGARVKRVVAREHTGLLERDVRTRIEKGFMKSNQEPWDPNILSATSTLEMGIDIGDLSTLALCSVPPEQSNYIQRIGRSGRRDGNSLNLTVATGRAHDLYFWADPKEMISGAVKTPGVYLQAYAILKRQFAAYSLDRWNCETTLDEGEGYGKLKACFESLDLVKNDKFPLSWFNFVEDNLEELLSNFLAMFPDVVVNHRETVQRLGDFARGKEEGFLGWVTDEFQEAKKERNDLNTKIKLADGETRKLKKLSPPPQDIDDQLDALNLEKRSLRELVKVIQNKDVLAFLTEHGVLPNYAFPEDGVTLKSVIYKLPERGKGDLKTTVYEYARPASSGLSDFAPPSRFYAEGRQVRIDEINLELSKIETWRVCPSCTYMEMVVGTEEDKPCPSCASNDWRDTSQKRDFIRLRQVIAVTNSRDARIGDDNEERKANFFDRSLFPSFKKDAIEEAYSLSEAPLPFGFEYINDCNFREVNFGEPGEGQGSFRTAGRDARGNGFKVCKHCGKIQNIKRRKNEPHHKPRCPAGEDDEPDDFITTAYLYREFPSEAIRILMPISALDEEKGVQSFIAGINLGLKLHFEGKVDHLRTTLLETAEGIVTRRFLYLYDAIPGGTGYLKQLMTNPDDFKAIFEKSLNHMQACGCNKEKHPGTDEPKDGCYKCVYAYKDSFRMEKISRSHAVQMFTTILESWSSIEKIETVNKIKINALIESELEAMFVERLEKMARTNKGSFRTITINGKKGYFLKLGDDAPAWIVEPQVWIDERCSVSVKTRADFVISPQISDPTLKPIAIYVDGWEFHKDRIGTDIEKRLAISRTSEYLTWSLSYYDLAKEKEKSVEDRTSHLWNPFADIGTELEELFSVDTCKAARDFSAAPLAKVLETYLKGSDAIKWDDITKILALSTSLNPAAENSNALIMDQINKAGGGAFSDYTDDLGTINLSMTVKEQFRFVSAIADPLDLENIHSFILLDDKNLDDITGKKAWNTVLRFLNLIQFSQMAHIAVSSYHDMPIPEESVGSSLYVGAWKGLHDLIDPKLHSVLDAIKDTGLEVPIIGYELFKGNKITAEAEMAWDEKKIAVIYPDYEKEFKEQGWRVFDCDLVIEEIQNLLDALT